MRTRSQKLAKRDLTRSHPSPPRPSHPRLDWLTSTANPTGNNSVPNRSSSASEPAAGTQRARTKASARGRDWRGPALPCLDFIVDFYVWHACLCVTSIRYPGDAFMLLLKYHICGFANASLFYKTYDHFKSILLISRYRFRLVWHLKKIDHLP